MKGSTVDHGAQFLKELTRTRVLAILRGLGPDTAVSAVGALRSGGMRLFEVTTDSPGWQESLVRLTQLQAGDGTVQIGTGTVLDVKLAEQARRAGATFLVSPVLSLEVAEFARESGLAYLPGAFSPAEIFLAHSAGATAVKVFPADTLGPNYIARVLQPMPFLKLVPTGGITPETAADYLPAGAIGVGMGSGLVDRESLSHGDARSTEAAARRLMAALK